MYPYTLFAGFDGYMLCIVLGAAGCLVLYRFLADRARLPDTVVNLTLASGLAGMAAGYAFAVLFQAFYDFLETGVFHITADTGATFYGGLIGGAAGFLALYFLAGHFFCTDRRHVQTLFTNLSLVASCIPFAHGFGRIGCLLAGCCYGRATDAWYGIYMVKLGYRVIPTQLIEAVFLFGLCVALCVRGTRGKRDGLSLYMIAYGVFRFLLEFLRGDDRGASLLPFLSPSQLTALLMIAGGVTLAALSARGRPAGGETAGQSTEHLAERPANQPAEQSTEHLAERPANQPAEQSPAQSDGQTGQDKPAACASDGAGKGTDA